MRDLDLIVLVADTDAEWTLRTLLEQRAPALGIRPVQCEVHRYPGRDAGVFRDAPDFLRGYLARAVHALVLLDYEGSGGEHRLTALEMEQDLETRLQSHGWAVGQAAAIVLTPELEVWVWSHSPHVATVLGVSQEVLQQIWQAAPLTATGKPQRPKETLARVLRRSRRPFSARIFQELAERVSLNVHERAFDKLRTTLQGWFPVKEPL